MKTSEKGIAFIKKWEGLRLKAYKCLNSERYYTIGYGHYGSDVKKGMVISKEQADAFLRKDIKTAEKAVNSLKILNADMQSFFDALVSFTYNCGAGNLKKLTEGRTLEVISDKILLYNKSGGVTISGLVKRRIEESAMMKECIKVKKESTVSLYYKCDYRGNSIVDALNSIGENSKFSHRKKIAIANGMYNYTGKASENIKMLNMLKNGILKRV